MDASRVLHEDWKKGDVYEPYIGRWSRLVAAQFIRWLSVPAQASWLDVGCGTAALSQTIFDASDPRSLKGIDPSSDYVEFARGRVRDARASFAVGDAQSLPVTSGACEVAVSGLVLNFVAEPAKMLSEMARAVCAGGVVALYVWDYAGKMQLMRHFWNAATALDPAAHALDEGRRFPICEPNALRDLFAGAALSAVEVIPIDIDTHFKDFNDYWTPFLGSQGPAPAYAMSLTGPARQRLRERIRESLPFATDGSIPLVARAWAARGLKRGLT